MKSNLIIISIVVILSIIVFIIINPFKKKKENGEATTEQKPNPIGKIVEDVDLDVWEEEIKEDLPIDKDRYTGERSKLRNTNKSTYYWGNGEKQTWQSGNTGIESGCYVTKDYTNDFDIYKLEQNSPILYHFYNQQIEDQKARDTGVVPETKNRDYEFETDKNNLEKYEKDQEAKQNPFFCMNVTTNPTTGNPNTDGCTKIEWDQNAWQDNLYNKNNKGEAFPLSNEKDFFYVGTDIYRDKKEISQGKGVCKEYDENSKIYKGVPCKNVIGKILENMMSEHQLQTKDNGPSCIIDKQTIFKWHNHAFESNHPSVSSEKDEKIFKSFDVNKNVPRGGKRALKATKYTSYVEHSANKNKDGENESGRILQLYGKESNLYKPFTYVSKIDDGNKNKEDEVVTLVYSNTGEQKFSPNLDFIENQEDYGTSFHMTDVGYEITNSKNPEDNHNGEGHLTAFYPTNSDNFSIGSLSGDSFAFVNKSFGEFETNPRNDSAKEVKSVFWRKIPTYMGKPLIHNNDPDVRGVNRDTRLINFIVGRGEDAENEIQFPSKERNFTYKSAIEQTADLSQSNDSVNPLQFFGDHDDTKIFCEIDVDFKNNKFDNKKNGKNQIKEYCYDGLLANTNSRYHLEKEDNNIDKKIYPIHGIQYCPENGGAEVCKLEEDVAEASGDGTYRYHEGLKDYWDTKCSRYMERYPFTGFYNPETTDARTENTLNEIFSKHREYKIATIDETLSTQSTKDNIPINITEISHGNPYYTNAGGKKLAFPFKIQPGLEFGITKKISNQNGELRYHFEKWRRDINTKPPWGKVTDNEGKSPEEIEIEYMEHLYYSIFNESQVSTSDLKNIEKNQLLYFPKNHRHASRDFSNPNENSQYHKTNKDDDGIEIKKGQISINDIRSLNTDINFKILENILIKYLFPIGSKVSVRTSDVTAPEIQSDTNACNNLGYDGWTSPGFYCLGVVNNNKGNHLGKLNLQINNIRGCQSQDAFIKDIINVNIPSNTELFVVKGIFTFPEQINKSICDTFKLSYSRNNLQHNKTTDIFTFGTSDLYKYNEMDIGSEDLIKDLYFASSHYDKKACFAVGEVLNQGREGLSEEEIKPGNNNNTTIIDRVSNEVNRKSFSVEPHINKYKGLYNLERNGNELRNSIWGSAICGITNHDSTYYPGNDTYNNFIRNNCPFGAENSRQSTNTKNGCSVKDFTFITTNKDLDPQNGNIFHKSFHNDIIYGKNQATNMPFKEGLFFKHDVNDIKNRYVTTFIGNQDEERAFNIEKLLKYNYEIKNKYWGTITQKERKVREVQPLTKKHISILYFVIPLVIIVCIILFFVIRRK